MRQEPDVDYYALLGLGADASPAELRRAWRRLALQWHPDRAGPGTTARFQAISAAYTVLSDPAARALYDRGRRDAGHDRAERAAEAPGSAATRAGGAAARGGGATAHGSGAAAHGGGAAGHGGGATARGSGAAPPSAKRRQAPGVMLSRITGSLNALLAGGVARRAPGGTLELFLNAQEAADGGMASISMRVQVRCPECAVGGAASCSACDASGAVEELYSAWLAVPPGVADGTILEPSARLPGMIRPLSFRMRVRA